MIPASISISMFLGAVIAAIIGHYAPDWRKKYVIVIAAGLVAGESLAGVVNALWSMAGGGG